jgi:hypothetical protein
MTTDTELSPTALLQSAQAVALPDTVAMARSSGSALRMAQSFTITCQEDYELAGEELRAVKAKLDAMEAKRVSVAGPLHKAWTALNALFKEPMQELDAAQTALKGVMLAWHQKKEEEARLARVEAERIAAAERKRLEDAARQLELEAKYAADLLADEANSASEAGDDLAAAQCKAEAAQVIEAAASEVAVMNFTASVMSAPVVPISSAKAKGASVSTTVAYEIVDMHALVKHIAANPTLVGLVIEDSVKMRNYVKGLGLNTALPGVRVFNKSNLSMRKA